MANHTSKMIIKIRPRIGPSVEPQRTSQTSTSTADAASNYSKFEFGSDTRVRNLEFKMEGDQISSGSVCDL